MTEATLHACIARLSERLNKIMKMKAFLCVHHVKIAQ